MALHMGKGRLLIGGISGLVLAGVGIAVAFLWRPHAASSEPQSMVGVQVEVVNPLHPVGNRITVPSEVMRALGIKAEPAQKATKPRSLPAISGRLALDNSTLARIPPRFPGEIVSVGTIHGGEKSIEPGKSKMVAGDSDYTDRPLRYGDRVKAGQLLAVLWSKDLGEKKSEFIDAVCRLKLDQEQLGKLEALLKDGATSEQSVRDARARVQADLVAAGKAERTLRSWRLGDADIDGLRKEAANVEAVSSQDANEFARWARVEIRSPQDGVIIEMNLSLGSLVTDTTADLFKIAETKKLDVWAYVYEHDLPLLNKLSKKGLVPWTVRLPSQPQDKGHPGHLQQVGEIIDSIQHTAIVMGHVDNTDLDLKVGQYVTVGIDLPPEDDEVEIPTTALVEDGKDSIVFVQAPGKPMELERRKVTVSRRYHDVVYVRGSLQPGELVVIHGALLLNDAMND